MLEWGYIAVAALAIVEMIFAMRLGGERAKIVYERKGFIRCSVTIKGGRVYRGYTHMAGVEEFRAGRAPQHMEIYNGGKLTMIASSNITKLEVF